MCDSIQKKEAVEGPADKARKTAVATGFLKAASLLHIYQEPAPRY
jgi:hypothetical protein